MHIFTTLFIYGDKVCIVATITLQTQTDALTSTVKPVYKDRSRDHKHAVCRQVVFIDRWITVRIAFLGPSKGGLYKQMVFIHRWSLGQVQLYVASIVETRALNEPQMHNTNFEFVNEDSEALRQSQNVQNVTGKFISVPTHLWKH